MTCVRNNDYLYQRNENFKLCQREFWSNHFFLSSVGSIGEQPKEDTLKHCKTSSPGWSMGKTVKQFFFLPRVPDLPEGNHITSVR